MICVSVGEPTVEACLGALHGAPLAEVRLDLVGDAEAGLERLFAGRGRRIATCRAGGRTDAEREELLLRALAAGAWMVDLELEAPAALKRRVIREARRRSRGLIVSFHDFEATPPRVELERIVRRLFAAGADYAKVACAVRSQSDAARLLGLLGRGEPIVVAGMGPKGRVVRAVAPLLGSPFTYAAPNRGKATAPGQPRARELAGAIAALRRAAGERR